jgi:hypothetical protein
MTVTPVDYFRKLTFDKIDNLGELSVIFIHTHFLLRVKRRYGYELD